MLWEKSKIKFDSICVTLMWLSSLHAAYGPGDYWYILVVIETTQTCLDLGGKSYVNVCRCCSNLPMCTWKSKSRYNDILHVAVESIVISPHTSKHNFVLHKNGNQQRNKILNFVNERD